MAAAGLLLGLALLAPRAAGAGMGACYDDAGRPQRCLPVFENAAFGRRAEASHTCGRPPEDFCPHVGAPGAGAQCQRCDAADPRRRHDAAYLTDFHSQDDSTWWQSPSMAFGVQYPTSVNLTLRLGKAYEITYVRLKFHTSRPESFAIYKRTQAGGPWEPYQYYSASCQKTYGRPEGQYLRPGEDERVAFCTSEFSDISPLSGGNVAFSTLEGRPSAYNFEESPVLQEWVTSTELLISLDRLNTFGDDIFKDPKVLQSYYYAVSDFSVGGRCKCNGHASECGPDAAGRLACRCQHNTTGTDCERCLPFFQDRPWARGTAEAANECVPCNCSGHSDECVFDRELFRSTGHGGRCLRCRDHTAGPHCERCQENFYRWSPQTPCQPCDCHPAGSLHLQCDASGTCVCKPTVTGWKCDRCRPGFHSLSEGGCRPCACSEAGSLGTCDPHSGRCPCKENVEGHLCDRCRPGTFSLQPHNPAGCTSCFCFGHSKVCAAAAQFREHHILSDLRQGAEGWRKGSVGGPEHPTRGSPRGLLLNPEDEEELTLPEKFLGDQRFSYGQPLTLTFRVPPGGSPPPMQLRLEGAGLALTLQHSGLSRPPDSSQPREVRLRFRLQETSEDADPPLPPFHFQRLLANLTALRIRAGRGPGPSGICQCGHHTEGPSCERCLPGFYGNPFAGQADDCQPCPCPGGSACTAIPESSEVVCTHCPLGQRGRRCEICDDGYFGDPLGLSGAPQPCQRCQCSGNVDPNAVGNCDPLSGHCLRCLHHTTGAHCERCQDGFYGNALAPRPADRCTPCDCHPEGSVSEQRTCDPVTGQCPCLPHVMGRDCGRCSPGFYDLQAGRGCRRCTCHPLGAQEDHCHSKTGQCPCRPGVEGQACDRCQLGFFGFSIKGCRACRCSPLGAASAQCHKNGTCVCKPGFVGYKCDRCQDNFFLTAGGTRCEECPSCYALVKEEAAKLKARLTLMEGWLQGSDCGQPWEPLHILQGEAPRGDVYQGHHLLQGAREAFLEQVTGLEGAVKAAREQLWALSSARCAQAQAEKTCIQLAELDAALESSEEEIVQAAIILKSLVIPQEGSSQSTTWSPLATEARALAMSHRDTTARIEAIALRALVASNTSYALLWSLLEGRVASEAQQHLEDRYQEVQAAQKALGRAVAQALPEAERALAVVQRVRADAALGRASPAASSALPQKSQAGALSQKVQALEETVASRERRVTEAAQTLQATARAVLRKIEPFTQLRQEARDALTQASSSVQAATVTVTGARTLLADLEGMKRQFPQPRDQAALGRKAGVVSDRLLVDLKKKTKQAERMLGNAASVSSSAKKKGREAELLAKDSAKLAKALLREGKQEHRRAGRLSSQTRAMFRQVSRQVLTSQARRRELEDAGQMGARLNSLERQIRESRASLERDVQALSELLSRLGSLDTHQAPAQALNETQWALERLRLQLSPPGALQGKLRLLQQESEQQELQIQSFENDLAEIRADKQNLEAILHSLPQSCASWQ
ncbi:laminin subunit gamma-3 isoform X2 [Mustela putorius furo]|uniref:Laminin subunit gamma-3 isoform X2 n=1 Tax=Mustela putorius furo TaxID=9669 RepID=A0A8U0S8T8_MUSPF|nr:laminin subunit gamma-3 isoform X2 [Mustela putorius furo]